MVRRLKRVAGSRERKLSQMSDVFILSDRSEQSSFYLD
jgi:hypothetical protein